MSENALLENRLNKTILAWRSGIESLRHLPSLNFGHVDDFRKEWLKRPEPDRLRNRLCSHQVRLQILATRQIIASVSVLRLGRMLLLGMQGTL